MKDFKFWILFIIVAIIFGILYFSTIYIIFPAYLSHKTVQGKQIPNGFSVLGYYDGSNNTIVILTDDESLRDKIYRHESCHRDYYLKSEDVNHKAGLWEELVCYTKTIW